MSRSDLIFTPDVDGVLRMLDAPEEPVAKQHLIELEAYTREQLSADRPDDAAIWLDTLSTALLRSTQRSSAARRVDLMVLAIEWLMKEGDLATSELLMIKATDVSRASGATAALRKALTVLGAVRCKQMNVAGAMSVLAEAADVAEAIGDMRGLCAALINISAVRLDLGLLDETIAVGKYIIALTKNEPSYQQPLATAHHNVAAAFELMGDLESAEINVTLSQRAMPPATASFPALSRILTHALKARILVRSGKVGEASAELVQLRAFAKRVGGRPAEMHVALTDALLAGACNDEARCFATLNELASSISPETPAYRDYLLVRSLCEQRIGRMNTRAEDEYLQQYSAWQRSIAIRQVGALQRSIRTTTRLTDSMISALPEEARSKLSSKTQLRRHRKDLLAQVESLATLAELREASIGEHSARVGWLSKALAKKIGYDDKKASVLDTAARLHDIGKLAVPDVVLLKRGKLTPTETEIVRRHALEGCTMLTDILASAEDVMGKGRSSEDQTLRLAAEIALHHHEWWDGSGYPRKLEGEAIPEAARIVAIADTFDDLLQTRPYHEASTIDVALLEVMNLSGKQFDPKLVIAFKDLIQGIQLAGGPDLDVLKGLTRKNTSQLAKANQVIERILKSPEAQHARSRALEPASATQH